MPSDTEPVAPAAGVDGFFESLPKKQRASHYQKQKKTRWILAVAYGSKYRQNEKHVTHMPHTWLKLRVWIQAKQVDSFWRWGYFFSVKGLVLSPIGPQHQALRRMFLLYQT